MQVTELKKRKQTWEVINTLYLIHTWKLSKKWSDIVQQLYKLCVYTFVYTPSLNWERAFKCCIRTWLSFQLFESFSWHLGSELCSLFSFFLDPFNHHPSYERHGWFREWGEGILSWLPKCQAKPTNLVTHPAPLLDESSWCPLIVCLPATCVPGAGEWATPDSFASHGESFSALEGLAGSLNTPLWYESDSAEPFFFGSRLSLYMLYLLVLCGCSAHIELLFIVFLL